MSESLKVDDASERSDEEQDSDLQIKLEILEEELLRLAKKPGGMTQEDADNGSETLRTILKIEAERKITNLMKKVAFKPGDNPEEVMKKMSTAEKETREINSFIQTITEEVVKMIKSIAKTNADLVKEIKEVFIWLKKQLKKFFVD